MTTIISNLLSNYLFKNLTAIVTNPPNEIYLFSYLLMNYINYRDIVNDLLGM